MRPTVLIAYAEHKDVAEELPILEAAGVEIVAAPTLDDPLAQETLPRADALMVTVQPVSAETLRRMDRCRIVCRVGTGLDAIDIPTATALGIWVTSVPDYSIDEVSAHAMALLLAQARQLFPHRRMAVDGPWRYDVAAPIRRLQGQTLGILGLGRIGKASARKGAGLGLRVIACDPFLTDATFAAERVERVDFPTLLAESDFLSLHVPLTDGTRGIIDAAALARMKPTAYLVNTARGEVVDVPAVVEAVRSGRIAGAALDVLPVEPPDANDPVLREERIIVTPHIAWASTAAAADVRVRGATDVVRVLAGERPVYPANELAPVAVGAAR